MGFGSFIKNIVTAPAAAGINAVPAVVSIVTAPVGAVVNIAKGENVLDSLGSAAKAVPQGSLQALETVSPTQVLNNATGGAVESTAGKVPVIGSILETNVSSQRKISEGDRSFSTLRDFGVSGAEIGGLVYGGNALAGSALGASLGAGITSAGSTALTGLGTAAVGAGIASFLPGGSQESSPQSYGDMLNANSAEPMSNQKKVLIIAGVAVVGYLLFRRGRK